MGSSSGTEPESQSFEKDRRSNEKSTPDWMNQIDAELAFRLIDSILPFEACLYHQILPLSLEGSRLKLGMVNPDDSAALDYVRRILAYMNCSLVPQAIASDVHYAALSAYLNYADQKKTSTTSQPFVRKIAKKLTEQSAKLSGGTPNQHPENFNSQATFVVDSPEVLPLPAIEKGEKTQEESNQPQPAPAQPATDQPLGDSPNLSLASSDQPPTAEQTASLSVEPAILEIAPRYLTDPPEMLATLPPKQLFEELLGRIISGGIGRLYLERQLDRGRILWSQNGVLQAVLEDLPLDLFESVIGELKQFVTRETAPVQKFKQIELERVYQNIHLLLRLRFIAGKHGEEVTLQALRGAALKFYQQQQLGSLGQDAIHLAQQLQQKMNDTLAYSKSHNVTMPNNLNTLPELDRLLKRLRYQLDELQSLTFDDISDDES